MPRALIVFIAVGVVLPIVRLLSYIGIARIGSARSSSLRSTHPFFSAVFAVTFLGEPAKHNIMLGTLLIVAGIFFTCWESRRIREPMPNRSTCFSTLGRVHFGYHPSVHALRADRHQRADCSTPAMVGLSLYSV